MTVKTEPLAIDAGTLALSEAARGLLLAPACPTPTKRASADSKAHKKMRWRERGIKTVPLVDPKRRSAAVTLAR